ncbi:MAG: Eco57I restriction-modification methylase domain-containing protein, partial [Blastocatellia bacterium]
QTLLGRLRKGELDKQDYYRMLLRLVYRLLFLFVAEDRELLFAPEAEEKTCERYTRFYSVSRLRRLAERRLGARHGDLYHGLRLVMQKLGNGGCAELGLPALGSFLFSDEAIADLNGCELANHDLLEAVRALAFITEGHRRRTVDYKNLRSEELGSVYEALLELHPEINAEARQFNLASASGNERKTTGSYYTPDSLVQCLLDSALDPVVTEALKQPDPEQAILSLKVCDPACGSGHFLIAAAYQLAKHLASVRTGDGEPAPEAVRTALRDVIGHSIYGVDINPMAVELCKVSLWMEALEPGKPLSFLEHRIQCGNSLIGATPALLKKGIPDEAFKPIEGDDKATCAEYRRYNKQFRESGQRNIFESEIKLGALAQSILSLEEVDDSTIEGVREKQRRWEELVRSNDYLYGGLLADAWCAAFVWKKLEDRNHPRPISEEMFRKIEQSPWHVARTHHEIEIKRLAAQYQFFHWHLAFPDVFRAPVDGEEPENEHAGWSGGFDVVLGNPPWERIKLQEKEWFAQRQPEIANAPNAATRRRMIEELRESNSTLYKAFLDDRRKAEGESHFVRNSMRYPLCGRGDVNTYAIFAEMNRMISWARGRVGCIVPSGIATDDTTKHFFADLMESGSLASLYDFENREGLFPEVDSRMKFCLLTMKGRLSDAPADFVFFAHNTADLHEQARHFSLSAADLALLNPNTRTCPIFRSQRDAELTKAIYRRVPVLINEGKIGGNPWGIQFSTMFHMSNDSGLFLPAEGGHRLPLYEAKMVNFFDHRAADVVLSETAMIRQGQSEELTIEEHADPKRRAIPRNWITSNHVDERLRKYDKEGYLIWEWMRDWLFGWRDVTSPTNERTFIPIIIPRVGVGNNLPLAFPSVTDVHTVACLSANLSAFAFDFVARQNVGGVHLNFFIVKQLPVLPPSTYVENCAWSPSQTLRELIAPRVLELTYTAHDLQGFAEDCGYTGEPFRWDEERRFLLRCELDAAYFHLYGIGREDVDYILDTFPIVKRKDEQAHGEYRTKRVILEIYDEMRQAMESGAAYQTHLDPPPASGWSPPEIEEDRGTERRGDGEKESGSTFADFQLRQEEARPQPGLFDKND